ncbi:hypothetical protein HPB48_019565 [Haemaphysalis longicornis]|uniref:Uncharacterized protein n=1 Tax=Haemaphysalis longicornis TaxID=44386 RepID=A0A9J6GKF0_HAELO|nr:hypothetical protein HPB48_019565 [Haemaphysalis longicornis]
MPGVLYRCTFANTTMRERETMRYRLREMRCEMIQMVEISNPKIDIALPQLLRLGTHLCIIAQHATAAMPPHTLPAFVAA